MIGFLARLRSFLRALRRPGDFAAEMDEEMSFHIEMEAGRLVRERGLSPDEAHRQAAIAFGGVEKRKEEGREVRGLAGVSGLSLDLKLAWRMLVKSPGFTVVGVLGLALGVALAVGFFVAFNAFLYPELPLDEGDRIVAIENRDTQAGGEPRQTPYDFLSWREHMRSVEQMSAFTMGSADLVTGDGRGRPVSMAQMTASSFQAARVPPLLGRYLVEADEQPGVPRVAVIGHDLWRERFAGDPQVVGRTVLIGDAAHQVVGVMPAGFQFPMNQEMWTPLHIDPSRSGSGDGRVVYVFGRLASGATWETVQAELDVLGQRAAANHPATHAHLRPEVRRYTHVVDGVQDVGLWEMAQVQLLVTLLLIAIAVNVAILVYARTAMRQGEIAVRSALGASRRRIVGQLFVEALVLSSLGAALGLTVAMMVLRQLGNALAGLSRVGYWVDFRVEPRTVFFTAALAVIAALIVGILPALKSTGGRLDADLRRMGNGTTVRLGWRWTVLIVAQVAVAVAVLPAALNLGLGELRWITARPTYADEEFLTGDISVALPFNLSMDAEAYRRETAARLGDRLPEMERRLESEPAVAGVTFLGDLPGRSGAIQVEGVPNPTSAPGHRLPVAGVGIDYFDLVGARLLAGRPFDPADLGDSARTVIVNRSFVRGVLGGETALGRRVRFVHAPEQRLAASDAERGPWLQIVGVVEDVRSNAVDPEAIAPNLYYPVAPGQLQYAEMLVHVRGGDTNAFAPRLRSITAALDPNLRLGAVENLATRGNLPLVAAAGTALLLMLATVFLLSAAGMHALMSLTVTRRRKEIGIRTALGAGRARLLTSIFSRAAWQLALGVVIGAVLGADLLLGTSSGLRRPALLLGCVMAMMLLVGLGAAAGPARRGIAIQPMETLRDE